MVVPPTPDKADLRRALRVARRAFGTERAFLHGPVLAAPLRAMIVESTCVAGYWPVVGEPDIRPLLTEARAKGTLTALPRIDPGTDGLRFHVWSKGDPTEAERGFRQPLATAPLAEPDLILVPLVGFDRALNRLGQGGGHYDRAFLAYPNARKVGIAWSVQEVPALPVEPHDIPLDALLTEQDWIT